MALLSIIVPVYNIASYLKEGLNSILNQNLKDIEVICINDGSTDSSWQILQTYSLKDDRIKLVSQNNQGVSAARNKGIELATGRYITFFDPDDSVHPEMYQRLTAIAIQNDLDVIICAYHTNLTDTPIIHKLLPNKTVTPKELLQHCNNWHSSNACCFSWRMLFSLQHIQEKQLRYHPAIRIGEDTLFNLHAILKAHNVFYLPEALYIYRVNNLQSVMKQAYKPYLEKSLCLLMEEKEKLIKGVYDYINLPDMYEDVMKRYTSMLFTNLKNGPKPVTPQDVRHILKLKMIRNASDFIGFKNIYPSLKEYAFYLAIKFRISSIVYKLIQKHP